MAERWNLTTSEWSSVLLKDSDPAVVAKTLSKGCILPWSKTLEKLTTQSKSTLDLGSGRGDHSALLALCGKATTLVDWSAQNITFSKQLYAEMRLKGEFYQADITKPLPFESNSFDTVFSCGVLEYFTNETIQNIIHEAFRVSSKQVIIMVPNATSWAYRIGKWYLEKAKKWEWGGEIPFYTLKPYFLNAGGSNIREFSVGGKVAVSFLSPLPMGQVIVKSLTKAFNLRDHTERSIFRQGYLLVTVADKVAGGSRN